MEFLPKIDVSEQTLYCTLLDILYFASNWTDQGFERDWIWRPISVLPTIVKEIHFCLEFVLSEETKNGFLYNSQKKQVCIPAGSMILRTPLQNLRGYLATAQAWKVAAAARHVIESMMFFWLSHRRGKEELLRKMLRPLPNVTYLVSPPPSPF